jgi:hypothetical protein
MLLVVRSELFWDVTQRRVVIPHRRFGTTYRSHLQGPINPRRKLSSWTLKMGSIAFPETSVTNYHSTLHNIPEERRSHPFRGGNLKSLLVVVTSPWQVSHLRRSWQTTLSSLRSKTALKWARISRISKLTLVPNRPPVQWITWARPMKFKAAQRDV